MTHRRRRSKGEEGSTFEKARTWNDLLTANRRFLRGELTQSPYWMQPVDIETVGLLEDLDNLNRLGFLSTESQPGTTETDNGIISHTREWVAGYVKPSVLKKLRDWSEQSCEFVVLAAKPIREAPEGKWMSPVEVTQTRFYNDQDSMNPDTDLQAVTGPPNVDEFSMFADVLQDDALSVLADTHYVVVIDRHVKRSGTLLSELIKILRR